MAKKLKTEANGEEKKARPGNNSYDPKVAGDLVDRIMALHVELEEKSGRIRGKIADVYDEAKDADIPKKLLKEIVTQKRQAEKLAKREADLEVDYPEELDKLKQALGLLDDTPLGRAAKKDLEERASH